MEKSGKDQDRPNADGGVPGRQLEAGIIELDKLSTKGKGSVFEVLGPITRAPIEKYRRDPLGYHSGDLARVLYWFRCGEMADRAGGQAHRVHGLR